MSTQRKPKALIDAEKKIVELEAKLKQETSYREMYSKMHTESQAVVDGLHEVLDDLGIRGYKDENKNYRLSLSVRLFAWAMSLANKTNK
jgi:hypothetical protein